MAEDEPRRLKCSAHSKRSGGQPCKQWALKGKTTCRVHGGKGGRPIIHGRYSKDLTQIPELMERYEDHKSDPEPQNLATEAALMRAVLGRLVAKHADEMNPKTAAIMADVADAVGKIVERKHKIDYGEQITITPRAYGSFVDAVLAAVNDLYGMDQRYGELLERIGRFYRPGEAREGKGESA